MKPNRVVTLGFLFKEDSILLAMKKRGFGAGKWNGFGGKVEPGESIEEALKRECREELNVEILEPKYRGQINFTFDELPFDLTGHIYSSNVFNGEPSETEEMRPLWYKVSDIPYGEMWIDDQYWLPLLLEGRNFEANFHFKDEQVLLDHGIKVL